MHTTDSHRQHVSNTETTPCDRCGRGRPADPHRLTVTFADRVDDGRRDERLFVCGRCWRQLRDDAREGARMTSGRDAGTLYRIAAAHDVEPVDAVGCGALGCHTDEPLFQVPTDAGERVLCPDHAADALDGGRA
jgi:hypothetical protein